MNKMVINHLERLFVTSDASTIVTELEVNHPAAKLLVHAAKAQEQEVGDGTNLVRLWVGGPWKAWKAAWIVNTGLPRVQRVLTIVSCALCGAGDHAGW